MKARYMDDLGFVVLILLIWVSNRACDMLLMTNTNGAMIWKYVPNPDNANMQVKSKLQDTRHECCRGFSSQWDVYFDQIQPLVTKMPYMTTIGNHERNWPNSGDRFPAQYDSGGECGVPYERRLQMPRPAEDKPWYSFDFGPIHFLQYSTEHDFAKGRLFLLLAGKPYSSSAKQRACLSM